MDPLPEGTEGEPSTSLMQCPEPNIARNSIILQQLRCCHGATASFPKTGKQPVTNEPSEPNEVMMPEDSRAFSQGRLQCPPSGYSVGPFSFPCLVQSFAISRPVWRTPVPSIATRFLRRESSRARATLGWNGLRTRGGVPVCFTRRPLLYAQTKGSLNRHFAGVPDRPDGG